MKGTVLDNVRTVKDLGITVSDYLNWRWHISNITSKANKVLGKLMKDVSEKRFGGKFNEMHHDQDKRDRVNEETFIYGNSVPLHSLPLEDLQKEWAKSYLPAILRTNPGKESSTLKTLRNIEQKIRFWFHNKS
jgi:hypothetical protein